MTRLLAAATLWLAAGTVLAQATSPATDARQVHWQRSLDDALALCRATGQPLLLAVNMDGESASDRIVHEEYVDPDFVALTRHCVCLGASVFRHNMRDHDDDGRRIPCPRFGGITCGEHMALEPQLWDKYLSDGERVAPRHALVLADGSKAFDLSLCFDLKDIDRALASAVGNGGLHRGSDRADEGAPPASATPPGDTWAELAARRDAKGRADLEAAVGAALARPLDVGTLGAALDAIAAHGDAGSAEALRLFAAQAAALPPRVLTDVCRAAAQIAGPGAPLALFSAVAEAPGALPGALDDPRRAAARRAAQWLHAGDDAAQRQQLFAAVAVGQLPSDLLPRTASDAPDEPRTALRPVDLVGLLQVAEPIAMTPGLPLPGAATDDMPTAEQLERRLDELDQTPTEQRDTPEWCAQFAKASLDLGRRRAEAGSRDAQLLFEDAEQFYARALARRDDMWDWWIERARAAYFRQQFGDEVQFGARAFALAAGTTAMPAEAELAASPILHDARAVESLRWIGDGNARLLAGATPGAGPLAAEAAVAMRIDGMRALGIAAASPFGNDKDWLTWSSFSALLGLSPASVAIAHCGVTRFPASRDLRLEQNAALWRSGRIDLAPALADATLRRSPSADAAWHAGYAWILAAEDARRRERPQQALAGYDSAAQRLAEAATRNADYADSCASMRAVTLLGKAMALLQAGDQPGAAELLPQAVAAHRGTATLRDGLGCDVLDVIDRIVEWRATGASTVDPTRVLAAIDAHAPDDPFYAAAISDALLREALRADGRNPVRKERRTVDAAGNAITMPMGLPNEEGDRYLLASIVAGRAAAARAQSRDDKLPLAQSLTIWAERGFERGDPKGVREALAEAAPLLELPPPSTGADEEAMRETMTRLREQLGEARPRQRDGR